MDPSERQRGGFGFMGRPRRDPDRADRRLIGDRIARLENELKKVQATRRLHRAGRQRVPYRVVALVGYTNAGKSTLFNRLTRATCRRPTCCLQHSTRPCARLDLCRMAARRCCRTRWDSSPTCQPKLVAAFRATLEEVLEADIILHVRDISHEDAEAQGRDVDAVLRQLASIPTRARASSKSGTRSIASIPKSAIICATSPRAARPSGRCFLVSAETGEGIERFCPRSRTGWRPSGDAGSVDRCLGWCWHQLAAS